MKKLSKLTYQKTGVDYSIIDPLKVLAQKTAQKTAGNISGTGFEELFISRGESAYVIDCGSFYLASITESLGTKVLVADAMRKITGATYYDQIAQDTIAMAVNDIIAVGARPLSIHAYWSAGSSAWFNDGRRMKDLVRGWKKACDLSGACWGGGETPALKGIIRPQAVDLAASCLGVIKPKTRLVLGKKLKTGDAIVALASSGIHANGLSLARKLAARLPEGYAAKISSNLMYGQALLKPTIIYAAVINAMLNAKVNIHYISNITGHGWQKIMRHPAAFTYRIFKLPPVPKVLQFIINNGNIEKSEAYASFNMGAGLAVFISRHDIKKLQIICRKHKIKAYVVGKVETGPKQVVLEPINLVYKGSQSSFRV